MYTNQVLGQLHHYLVNFVYLRVKFKWFWLVPVYSNGLRGYILNPQLVLNLTCLSVIPHSVLLFQTLRIGATVCYEVCCLFACALFMFFLFIYAVLSYNWSSDSSETWQSFYTEGPRCNYFIPQLSWGHYRQCFWGNSTQSILFLSFCHSTKAHRLQNQIECYVCMWRLDRNADSALTDHTCRSTITMCHILSIWVI